MFYYKDLQDLPYIHSYDLLQCQDTQQNQQREEPHEAKVQEKPRQTSKSSLSTKSHRTCLIKVGCEDTWNVANQESLLDTPGFLLGG